MAIDSVDKFGTARDRLEAAMDLLRAIEEIADAHNGRGGGSCSGIRAVAIEARDALIEVHELFFENGTDEAAVAAMKAA